jgi:hypothetical protein
MHVGRTQSHVRGRPGEPFRFLYMSGIAAERDQTKTPFFMPPYTLMRVSQHAIACHVALKRQ